MIHQVDFLARMANGEIAQKLDGGNLGGGRGGIVQLGDGVSEGGDGHGGRS